MAFLFESFVLLLSCRLYYFSFHDYPPFFYTVQPISGLVRKSGHHSFSSILGNWLAIDDKKNNISASLCLTSYLAANWLQKLKAKYCVYYAEVISVLMSVCLYVCVWYLNLIYL